MKINILVSGALIIALGSSAFAVEIPLFGATEWPIGRCDVDTADPQSFHLGVELGIQRWDGDKLEANAYELWFFRCSRILHPDQPGVFLKECSLVRQTLGNDPNATWQVPAQFYSLESRNLELVTEKWKEGFLRMRTTDTDVVETDVHFSCDSKSGEIRLTDFVAHTIAQAGNPPKYRAPDYRVPKESFSISRTIRITGLTTPKVKK